MALKHTSAIAGAVSRLRLPVPALTEPNFRLSAHNAFSIKQTTVFGPKNRNFYMLTARIIVTFYEAPLLDRLKWIFKS